MRKAFAKSHCTHSCNRTVRSSRYIVFERKSMPIVAWYMLLLDVRFDHRIHIRLGLREENGTYSKLSYMNRVMSDVFPTDCSPRKTSYNWSSQCFCQCRISRQINRTYLELFQGVRVGSSSPGRHVEGCHRQLWRQSESGERIGRMRWKKAQKGLHSELKK